MPKHVLFEAKRGWDLSNAPAPFDSWDPRSKEPGGMSEFNNSKQYSTLHAYVVKAVMAYAMKVAADMALVEVGAGTYSTEFKLPDDTVMLTNLAQNGKLRAAIVTTTGRYQPLPTIGSPSDDLDLSPIFLALLPQLTTASKQAADALEEVCQEYAAAGTWAKDQMYLLCDGMYHGLTNNHIRCNIPAGNVDLLPEQTVKAGVANGVAICGNPQILNSVAGQAAGKSGKRSLKEVKAQFAAWAQSHCWEPEEEELIPKFPDDYPVPTEVVKIATRYVRTHGDKRPMVNFMWRGITSYGKSTGVELLACILHMPLLRVTCHSTMETQDFLSVFVPDNGGSGNAFAGLPSFEEISLDPCGAYYKLTGIEDANATPDMCLEAYGKVCIAASGSGTVRFKHVESNFVKGLARGYLVEVQEISRIKDAGVLVGLNEYDRPGAVIPLVDGTFTRRHPDAIVVYTDNVGYASCRPIDPSVLRRMAFIIDSYEIPKEDAINRVLYNTKFSDKQLLEMMYNVWTKIGEFCKEHEINEGSVSVTELEMWAQAVQADGMSNVRENCIECVVAKATSDIDEQQEIISSVVAVHLAA